MSNAVNGNQNFIGISNISDSISNLNISSLIVSNQKSNKFECFSQVGLISLWTGDVTDIANTVPILQEGPSSCYVCNGATITTEYVNNFILPVITGPQANCVYVMYLGPYIS